MASGIPFADLDDLKKGKNYLFGIGIQAYEHFAKLPNARKDVMDVAQILEENYYFEREHIRLLCDGDATKANIIDELDGLRSKVQAEDRLLIYYSGHGFLDGEIGYWIPVDAAPRRASSYIRNAEVRDIIHSIKARHILLISDSCFSAALLARDASRDIGGAFTDWIRNSSRYVFISGKGVVSDGKVGENSPFAKGILKCLRQNDDEALNIVSLADKVTKGVRWNYEQQAELSPLYQSGHDGGQFVFLKRHTEKDHWESALRLNTEGAYLGYLDKYSNGQFVKEAYQKLGEIADEKEWQNAVLLHSAFAYKKYLLNYPQGKHAAEAQGQLDSIRAAELPKREDAEKRTRFDPPEGESRNERKIKLSSFQKYKAPVIIGGVIALALFLWLIAKPTSVLPQMISAPGGTFKMGSNDGLYYEKPIHVVSLNHFYIGKYEITVAQFAAFIKETAYVTSAEREDSSHVYNENHLIPKRGVFWKHGVNGSLLPLSAYNHPVIHVSWLDAMAYCEWLSRKTGKKYRLPTEAEWEYAAKGSNKTDDYKYSGSPTISDVAWYEDNGDKTIHAVGTKQSNELNIFDMSGNVWEWCNDWFSKDYYTNSPSINPSGPISGNERVIRGGSWKNIADDCRVANRSSVPPMYRDDALGFRVVCSSE